MFGQWLIRVSSMKWTIVYAVCMCICTLTGTSRLRGFKCETRRGGARMYVLLLVVVCFTYGRGERERVRSNQSPLIAPIYTCLYYSEVNKNKCSWLKDLAKWYAGLRISGKETPHPLCTNKNSLIQETLIRVSIRPSKGLTWRLYFVVKRCIYFSSDKCACSSETCHKQPPNKRTLQLTDFYV